MVSSATTRTAAGRPSNRQLAFCSERIQPATRAHQSLSPSTMEDPKSCATRTRGWRRRSPNEAWQAATERGSEFEGQKPLEVEVLGATPNGAQPNSTVIRTESTRLEMETNSDQKPSWSNRFTHIACARAAPTPSASLSLAISADLVDESRAGQEHLCRRAIIPRALRPLLAISILLSILSLSFAAVSLAASPAKAAGKLF